MAGRPIQFMKSINAQALQPSAAGYAESPVRRRPAAHTLVWLASAGAILIVAALVRLYALELRPLHNDEGVNAFFMMRLVDGAGYQYDPTNYHGPTLYYLTLVIARLLGLTIFAMRLLPALCGVATVWLMLCLRRYVGTFGALAGAALLALSPGAVYMSRYFIHESLLVLFTFAVVVAGFRYWESKHPGYLLCAAVAAGLVFATKETAIISAAVLILAIFLAPLLMDIRKALFARTAPGGQSPQIDSIEGEPAKAQASPRWRGELMRPLTIWVAAGGAFIFVLALFYSSLFTHRQWLGEMLQSYQYWARAGRSDHRHGWYIYFAWLLEEEFLLLALGLIGVGLIVWRSHSRFLVFTSIWLCGLLGAYSIIPYKTPWLVLNFIVPLAIIAGYTVNEIRKRVATRKQRALVAGALAVVSAVSLAQMIRLNFLEYDDGKHPYVYAHTRRELLSLVAEVSRIADRAGTGRETTMTITASEYWPLPWYLRDYRQVAYPGQLGDLNASIIIGTQDQDSQLKARLGEGYERVAAYLLRPGLNLVLYTRRGMAEPAQALLNSAADPLPLTPLRNK